MTTMTGSTAVVPVPGADLVPDGWWSHVVVPWADRQSDAADVAGASAQVAGLISVYETLGSDTLELTKARRYLELRWGELLGEVSAGERTDLEPSHASEGSLSKDDRHRFRQLAAARSEVLELLERACDPDEITRAACTRLAKPKPSSPRDAIGMVGALEDDEDERPGIEDEAEEAWSESHARRARRIGELFEDARAELEQAAAPGLSAHGISELLRSAEIKARQASAQLGNLAFSFER